MSDSKMKVKKFRPAILVILLILAPVLKGQDTSYVRKIIETLSSPEFSGRGYVDEGHLKAAGYIRNEFLRIGLKSFEGNYYQPFTLEVNTFPSDMELSIDETELKPGTDFIADPASCSVDGEFQLYYTSILELTSVEALGKLMEESEGKFLVIDETKSETLSKEESSKVRDLMDLFRYNPKIKSAGTIIMNNRKPVWSISTEQADKPSLMLCRNMKIRKNSKVNVNIKADHIRCTTNNVIGYIEGRQHPDTFLVATAHYDHLGKMGSSVFFPGANDNASGIAMLLYLAEYFKNNPPDYSIVFIAFAAEEAGLLGSRHFVANPLFDLSHVAFLVNFDLAGNGEEGIQVVNGSIFRENFDLLVRLNADGNFLDTVKTRGAACNSDHCAFYEKGIPCFYIYTLGGSKAYHDIYDTPQSLPLTEFKDNSDLMIKFFKHLQNPEQINSVRKEDEINFIFSYKP